MLFFVLAWLGARNACLAGPNPALPRGEWPKLDGLRYIRMAGHFPRWPRRAYASNCEAQAIWAHPESTGTLFAQGADGRTNGGREGRSAARRPSGHRAASASSEGVERALRRARGVTDADKGIIDCHVSQVRRFRWPGLPAIRLRLLGPSGAAGRICAVSFTQELGSLAGMCMESSSREFKPFLDIFPLSGLAGTRHRTKANQGSPFFLLPQKDRLCLKPSASTPSS